MIWSRVVRTRREAAGIPTTRTGQPTALARSEAGRKPCSDRKRRNQTPAAFRQALYTNQVTSLNHLVSRFEFRTTLVDR